MTDKIKENSTKFLNNQKVKTVIAAVAFHIVYSFAFGMLIGGKNPLTFMVEENYILPYMILMPFIASLPYIASGYLITLARNDNHYLKEKNTRLFLTTLTIIISVYLISIGLQYLFPYRNMLGLFLLINYPAVSHIITLESLDLVLKLLLILSAIFPPLMTFIGGLIRIRFISKEGIYGQDS